MNITSQGGLLCGKGQGTQTGAGDGVTKEGGTRKVEVTVRGMNQ